jgi:hypothetical protein
MQFGSDGRCFNITLEHSYSYVNQSLKGMGKTVYKSRFNISRIALLCIAAFHMSARCCRAQDQLTSAISTERPTIGSSSPVLDLVPAGSLQVESGGGISIQRKEFVADLPETFVRIGLSNRIELRYFSSNLVYQHSFIPGLDPVQSGDSALGAKLLLGPANSFVPMSAVLSLSFPVGAEGMSSGSHDPSLTLAWTQTAPGKLTLIEGMQSTITTRDGERHPSLVPSLGIGRPLSDRFGAFVDYAPNVFRDPGMAYMLDGGLSYVRSSKQLFDARLGFTEDCEGVRAYVADVGLSYARSSVQQFDLRIGYSSDSQGLHTVSSFGYSVRYDKFFQSLPILNRSLAHMNRLRKDGTQ